VGVVGGTVENPRVTLLPTTLPVTDELLELARPVRPTEVFRFAAPCLCNGCSHFNGTNCRLATKITRLLPTATDALPECAIRPQCRWYRQEGSDACQRCPAVVTDDTFRSSEIRVAADPATPVPNAPPE
jgi:hypothetical protein